LQSGYVFAVERHAALVDALGISEYAVGTAYKSFDHDELPDGLSPDDVFEVAPARPRGARKRTIAKAGDDKTTVALFDAAGKDDVATIRRIIEQDGLDPETLLSNGYTPLHVACYAGSANAAAALLDFGADPNRRYTYRLGKDFYVVSSITALIYAANADVVSLMLTRGADPNAASSDGFTPLMNAALRCDLDSVKALLAAGANPLATGRQFLLTAADEPPKTARQFAEMQLSKFTSMPDIPQLKTPQLAAFVEKIEQVIAILSAAERQSLGR